MKTMRVEDCNSLRRLVGAWRFELQTSCAQVRRTISKKSFLFNLCFENKRVRKLFDSGVMYRNVAPHGWSPLNFHHSEEEAKVTPEPQFIVETQHSCVL